MIKILKGTVDISKLDDRTVLIDLINVSKNPYMVELGAYILKKDPRKDKHNYIFDFIKDPAKNENELFNYKLKELYNKSPFDKIIVFDVPWGAAKISNDQMTELLGKFINGLNKYYPNITLGFSDKAMKTLRPFMIDDASKFKVDNKPIMYPVIVYLIIDINPYSGFDVYYKIQIPDRKGNYGFVGTSYGAKIFKSSEELSKELNYILNTPNSPIGVGITNGDQNIYKLKKEDVDKIVNNTISIIKSVKPSIKILYYGSLSSYSNHSFTNFSEVLGRIDNLYNASLLDYTTNFSNGY